MTTPLTALIAQPDDAALRLVFADWLEEGGDLAWAQMVRLGVEMTSVGGRHRARYSANYDTRAQTPAEAERAAAIFERMSEIGEAMREQRDKRLPVADGITWMNDHVFGGIPEGVSASDVYTFLAAADELAQQVPIRALAVDVLDRRGAKKLVATGWLGKLRHLSLHGAKITGNALAVLLAENASSLRSIDLSLSQIGDKGAEVIATSPHMASLETLHLYAAQISDKGATAIARSPYLQQLRSLDLELNWLDATSAKAFCAPDIFPQMLYLNLYDNEPLEHGGHLDALRERWGDRLEI